MKKKSSIVQQRDHVILPKATLMRFVDCKTKKISCLNFSDSCNLTIRRKFPKSYHAEMNFYNPEFDDTVKYYETLIGNLNKLITDKININSNLNPLIDPDKLKKDMLELITIQYHRSVLADPEQLLQFIEVKKKRYERQSLELLRKGALSKEFVNKKILFQDKSKDIIQYRYYIQHILGQRNNNIEKTYANFSPYILHIPSHVNSTFTLSPQHFVPNDEFARFVLSPRLALALYPQKNMKQVITLSKDDADLLVIRTIESALSMSTEYREIIGEETQLLSIKKKFLKYKSYIKSIEHNRILFIHGNESNLHDNQTILEMIITIMYFEPMCKKIILDVTMISEFLLKERTINCKDGLHMFIKYGYMIVLLMKKNLEIPIGSMKVTETKEQAIELLLRNNKN